LILSNNTFSLASGNVAWNGTTLSVNGNGAFTGELTSTSGTIGGWIIGQTTLQGSNGAITLDSSNKSISIKDSGGVSRINISSKTAFTGTSGAESNSGTSTTATAVVGGAPGASVTQTVTTISANATGTYQVQIVESYTNGSQLAIQASSAVPYGINEYQYYVTDGTTTVTVLSNSRTLFSNTEAYFVSNNNTGTITFTAPTTATWTLYRKSRYIIPASPVTGNTWFPTVNWSWERINSFVEVISGGIQVVRGSSSYVKMDRDASTGPMLLVGGEIAATGNITAFYTSDKRLKENIIPISNALDKVDKLNGVTFDWKEGYADVHSAKGHDVGLIAQEVEAIIPEIVNTRDDGYKAIKYEKLVALLIEAVKELKEEVDELKNK
jgi:hypothetical protein